MAKKIKQWISNLKYHWSYLGVLNSPFVGLRLKWYFGDIKHGTPYFLPRKWVKCDYKDAVKAWQKLSSESRLAYSRKVGGVNKWLSDYIGSYTKPIPIKYFGWNSCTLGWKTKWRADDYRFEWAPCYSLVIFGKQLFVCVLPKMKSKDEFGIRQDCYWEAYLTYSECTDKTKSKTERLQETIKKYSCTWGNEREGYTDYYPLILKKKYHKLCVLE
jgi:hypothetical protein